MGVWGLLRIHERIVCNGERSNGGVSPLCMHAYNLYWIFMKLKWIISLHWIEIDEPMMNHIHQIRSTILAVNNCCLYFIVHKLLSSMFNKNQKEREWREQGVFCILYVEVHTMKSTPLYINTRVWQFFVVIETASWSEI